MEELRTGKKTSRKRRKLKHVLEQPADEAAAAAAADNGTSPRVETRLPTQLVFLDDAVEEVRICCNIFGNSRLIQ